MRVFTVRTAFPHRCTLPNRSSRPRQARGHFSFKRLEPYSISSVEYAKSTGVRPPLHLPELDIDPPGPLPLAGLPFLAPAFELRFILAFLHKYYLQL